MNATLLLPERTDQEYLEMEAMLMAFIDDVRSQATASDPPVSYTHLTLPTILRV